MASAPESAKQIMWNLFEFALYSFFFFFFFIISTFLAMSQVAALCFNICRYLHVLGLHYVDRICNSALQFMLNHDFSSSWFFSVCIGWFNIPVVWREAADGTGEVHCVFIR